MKRVRPFLPVVHRNYARVRASFACTLFLLLFAASAGATNTTVQLRSAWPRLQEGNSGISHAVFPVRLTAAAAVPITVHYRTYDYTADGGTDYQPVAGTLIFAPGETEKTVAVPVFGDTMWEYDEEFDFYAWPDTGGGYVLAWAVIENDDPAPKLSIRDLEVVEGEGDKTVYVTVEASSPVSTYLYVSTRNGSATWPADYQMNIYYVFVHQSTDIRIPVVVKDDEEVEGDEWFTVRIDEVYSSEVDIVRAEATVTILNDETSAGPAEQRIGVGETGSFAIELGAPVAAQGVVQVESSNPSVIAVPSSITIRPGDRRTGFDARALALGSASITIRLPNGETHLVTATTFIRHRLVLTPGELALFAGQTIRVTASLQPGNDQPVTVSLENLGDAVTLPTSIVIPPHGSATFDVVAAKEGPIVIHAAIGSNEAGSLFGHVSGAPTRPTIFRITPPNGPTAGGTLLDVTGVRFERGCEVLFGSIPARGVQYLGDTQLRVTTPAHGEGTVDVLLACPSGTSPFANGFTFVAALPELSGIAPASGNTGGGSEVRIGGRNFRSSCWPFFGGVAATSATVVDPATLNATVPPHAAGTVNVTLRCTEGEALLDDGFMFVTAPDAAPLIESVHPYAGAPGEVVAVEGQHFRRGDRITFGGAAATILATQADRQLVRVPELPPGSTDVTLTDAEGRVTTTGPVFTVLEAVPPFITSVTPASLPAGAELTLEGRGFRPGYVFRIGGRAASVLSLEYTRIVLRIDDETPAGTHAIEVLNAAGLLAGIGPGVTIAEDGLALFAIDVPCTTTEGNVLATLTGRGFAAGAMVAFNGIASTDITVANRTTIRVRVPAGEAGPAVVQVNVDGWSATLTSAFRYVSPFDPGGCGPSVRH